MGRGRKTKQAAREALTSAKAAVRKQGTKKKRKKKLREGHPRKKLREAAFLGLQAGDGLTSLLRIPIDHNGADNIHAPGLPPRKMLSLREQKG